MRTANIESPTDPDFQLNLSFCKFDFLNFQKDENDENGENGYFGR